MKGVAHKLPLLPNATKLSVAEMSWLVNVALQLSKSCAAALSSPKHQRGMQKQLISKLS